MISRTDNTSFLERYAHLVDDFAGFTEACYSPLPTTCWVPPDRKDGSHRLQSEGHHQTEWNERAWRLTHPGQQFGIAFLTGAALIQEEAAMAAVEALAPKLGERILDLCAAPGNKTVQLSKAVGNTGWIVANDVSPNRLQVLRGLKDRFSLTNVTVTVTDGRRFPLTGEQPDLSDSADSGESGGFDGFDAVLADVPCSCEGTCRKHPSVLRPQSEDERARLTNLQEELLRRAIRLARPGGRILYATCTFAPEENEAVVDRVLRRPETGQDVDLTTCVLPGLRVSPGIDQWNGKTFSSDMHRAIRLWPEANDTGGFFLALMVKAGGASHVDGSAQGESALEKGKDPDGADNCFNTTPWSAFSISDSAFQALESLEDGRKYTRLAAAHRGHLPSVEWSVGMTGMNLKSGEPRFSTPLALKFASMATAGVAELEEKDIVPFLCREVVRPSAIFPSTDQSPGLLVRSGSTPLGLGHDPRDGSGIIASLFPKHWAGLEVAQWLKSLER